MPILVFWIVFCVFVVSAGNSADGSPSSLWCLSVDSDVPCKILGGVPIPPRLLEIYANQNSEIRNALDNGNFSTIEEDSLDNFSPVLLLMISSHKLTSFGGYKLAQLILRWQKIPAVTKHLAESVTISEQVDDFLCKFQNVNIPADILDIIGEEVIIWNKNSQSTLKNIHLYHNPFLAHLPLGPLVNALEKQPNFMLYFLAGWMNAFNSSWSTQSKAIQRLWAQSLVRVGYRQPLYKWTNSDLMWIGKLLIGCTPNELHLLNSSLIENRKLLLSFNFTTLQIRALFNNFYVNKEPTANDLEEVKPFLLSLTPKQLLHFPCEMINYSLVGLPSEKSLPAVKQVIECLILNKIQENPLFLHEPTMYNMRITNFGKFFYALPLSDFKHYKKSLLLSELIPIQSEFMSALQVFLVTDSGSMIDLKKDDIVKCQELLHGLPTSSLKNISVSSKVLFHLLEHMPGNNIPRSITLLDFFLDRLGDLEVFRHTLRNRDVNIFTELIPSPYIRNNSEKIIESMSEHHIEFDAVKYLTSDVLSNFLAKERGKTWTWELVENSSHPFFLFLSGITCEDIYALQSSDFMVVMSKYNSELKNSRKVFRKDLQHCCTEKLVSYLQLKSTVTQRYEFEAITSLLTEAEITALGGYILADLPLHFIKTSKHFVLIVKTIGKLSLPELLIVAPKSKLQDIVQIYTKDRVMNARTLFELGNLTLFAPENVVRKIEPLAFKLILECQHIDTRLCANTNELKAWEELIFLSFGKPDSWDGNTIVTLNDMMVAIPFENLISVNESTLIEAADILTIKYDDEVEWVTPTSFYKVCASLLGKNENYLLHLNNYIRWNLYAVQTQLNSISLVKTLLQKNNSVSEVIETISESDLQLMDHTESYVVVDNENMNDGSQNDTTVVVPDNSPISNSVDDGHHTTQTFDSDSKESVSSSSSQILAEQETSGYMGTTLSTSINVLNISTSNTYASHNYKDITTVDYSSDSVNIKLSTQTYSASQPNKNEADNTNSKDTSLTDRTVVKLDKMVSQPEKRHLFNNSSNNFSSAVYNDNNFHKISNSDYNSVSNETLHLKSNVEHPLKTETIDSFTTSSYSSKKKQYTSDEFLMNSTSRTTNICTDEVTCVPHLKVTDKRSTISPNLALTSTDTSLSNQNKTSTTMDVGHSLKSEETSINEPTTKSSIKSYVNNLNLTDELESDLQIISYAELYTQKNDILRTEKEGIVSEFLKEHLNKSFITNRPILKELSKRDVSPNKITCAAVKMVGKVAEISLTINDFKVMSSAELLDCIEIFGKMNLSFEIMMEIWSRVPKDAVHLMGKLVRVANISDVRQINFKNAHPWALETLFVFGQFSENQEVKQFIKNQIIKDTNHPLPPGNVAAMGTLICDLPNHKIRKFVTPSAFLKSSAVLGSVLPCDIECLSQLVSIAIDPLAFGDLKSWTPEDVKNLGVIVAGLSQEQWRYFTMSNYKALAGIQPNLVDCLPKDFWSEIPEHSLPFLPALMVEFMKNNITSVFSPKQIRALNTKLLFSVKNFEYPSSSVSPVRSSYFVIVAIVLGHIFIYMIIG